MCKPETNRISFWFPFFHEPPCTAGSNVVGKDEVHSGLSTTKDGDSRHEVNLSFSTGEVFNYICVICNDSYPQKSMLVNHIVEKHCVSRVDTISDDDPDAEDISDDEQTSATGEEVATPSRRSSRLSKKRPRKWDAEDYAPDLDKDDVNWSPSPTAKDGTVTARRSSRCPKRQQQQSDVEDSGDEVISKRKKQARSMDLTQIKKEPEADVEESSFLSFLCRVTSCSSTLGTRQSLIKHMMGQHKYNNQRAVKMVQTWYKYKPNGHSKKPKHQEDPAEDMSEHESEESDEEEESVRCLIPSCSSELGTRRSLNIHMKDQHGFSNQEAVEMVQTWYKLKPKDRPKMSEQAQKGVTKEASDVEQESFICHISPCTSKLKTRKLLIRHVRGKHKYDNQKAIKVVQTWYKYKPQGRPRKDRSKRSKQTQNTECVEGKSEVRKESFSCCIPSCTSKLGTRRSLITHVMGQHKHNNQEAVEMVQTWYTRKPKGRPKNSHHKQTQNTEFVEGKSEVKKESFSCCFPSCTSKLGTRRSLITHVMGQHKHNNQEAVKMVQTWYTRKPKGRPKNSHQSNRDLSKNPFVCEICRLVSYPRKQKLRDHMCEEHGLTKEQSEAEVAKVYGVLRSNRRRKLPDSVFCASGAKIEELHVGSDTNQASQSSDVVKIDTKPSCPKCGREFEHISQARMHFENDCTSNPLECDVCGSNFESMGGYKCHMESHKNKEAGITYECQQCDKVFYHRYLLVQHEATHKNNFMCEVCSKCFGYKGALERHRNLRHTREEKYPCTLCPKVYYAKRQLKYHMKMVHEGHDEIVTCHICGKSVKKSCMGNHVKLVHTETEKVTCPLCEREFKRQSYLDDHLKEVHGSGQTETFPCPWPNCDKTFVRKRSLKAHYDMHRDHRPFSCTMCSNKFRSKSHLQNHLNWHNGVRPHQCQLCSKSFLTKGNLTKHLKTHSKRTPGPSVATQPERTAPAPAQSTVVTCEAKDLLTAIAQAVCDPGVCEPHVAAPVPGDSVEYKTIDISTVPYTVAYTS